MVLSDNNSDSKKKQQQTGLDTHVAYQFVNDTIAPFQVKLRVKWASVDKCSDMIHYEKANAIFI